MRERIFFRPALRIVLGAGIGVWLAHSVAAQTYERVAPKEPVAPLPAPEIVPPPATPAPAAGARVILATLKGLRLVDNAAAIERTGAKGAGVTIVHLPLLDAAPMRDKLASWIGKKLTFADLNAITQAIVAWYRAHDRPFVDVSFPEQDVSTGVVQGIVTEFRVGTIRVEGNKWFSGDLLRGQVRLQPGDPVDAARLEQDAAWLNQNPFRRVNIVAEKGTAPGTTDLVLETADRFPLRVYAGYDNTGTPVLGHDRWNLGFNWGNAFWADQQISYQFTSSDDFWHDNQSIPGLPDRPSFTAHSISYVAPLPWRDKISVFGFYERAVPRLGPSVGVTGISGQASLRYIMPLPGSPRLVQQLTFGYDFKTANNDIVVPLFPELDSSNESEIHQFPLSYDASLSDRFGQTSVDNTFVYSPGGLSPLNTNVAFQQQVTAPAPSAHYVYDTLHLARTTRLPGDASWVMRFVGQAADHDLLPSEQLTAGGFDSVRGYDTSAATGSFGLLVSEELRSPAFSLAKLAIGHDIGDEAQVLAFWDYGVVRSRGAVPTLLRCSLTQAQANSCQNAQIESVGLGLRYTIARYLDLRLDYGWQLRKLPSGGARSQMGQIAVTLSY